MHSTQNKTVTCHPKIEVTNIAIFRASGAPSGLSYYTVPIGGWGRIKILDG